MIQTALKNLLRFTRMCIPVLSHAFKSNRYSFIQFMLNHLPFKRSANPEHEDKSAAEIFTGKDLPEWTEYLNLTRFKRAA